VITVSSPGTRAIWENFLHNAKGRLGVLEKKIHEAEHEKEQQARSEVALVALAERETALSVKEKEQYNGFLREDFFTKKDFARLDDFYAHAWDRLSEHGKNEMSKRIWEGVRRNEYKFTDLPKDVQEKEEKQALRMLREPSGRQTNVALIPETDKNDFIRAYESGNNDGAAKVLDRDSFKKNMFLNTGSSEIRHASVTIGKDSNSASVAAGASAVSPDKGKDQPKPPKDGISNLDVSSFDLGGMKPAESASQGSVASLPRNQGGASRGC
jgi:hypothetical protein